MVEGCSGDSGHTFGHGLKRYIGEEADSKESADEKKGTSAQNGTEMEHDCPHALLLVDTHYSY